MNRYLVAAVVFGLCATASFAQTKFSGTIQCGLKPVITQVVQAGDQDGHTFGVEQFKCTWTKPAEFAGAKAKDHVSTENFEATGGTLHVSGTGVTTLENGDKWFGPYHGTSTFKDGSLVGASGKWQFGGGTGKLQGIKGKGTYKCTADKGGTTFTCDIEGEYQLGS
jgi:hypothetical protein